MKTFDSQDALFINQILDGLKHIHKPQLNFFIVLFSTVFVCQAGINFSSLASHSALKEKTFRRNFRKEFDFARLNEAISGHSKCRIEAFASGGDLYQKERTGALSDLINFGIDVPAKPKKVWKPRLFL